MARLFSLDVERLRRFSRGLASLPKMAVGHNKVDDVALATNFTVVRTDRELSVLVIWRHTGSHSSSSGWRETA